MSRRFARTPGNQIGRRWRQWYEAAEEMDDRKVLDEAAREMVWILNGWGREDQAERLERRRAMEFDEQMRLF